MAKGKQDIEKIRFIPDLPGSAFTRELQRKPPDEEDEEFLAWKIVWGGTLPEFLIFRGLEQRGKEFGIDFVFQAELMGGRNKLGGAVVDFVLDNVFLGRVQGEFWHLSTPEARGHDIIQRRNLEAQGWFVIDMLEGEIIEAPQRIVGLYIKGQESARARATLRR